MGENKNSMEVQGRQHISVMLEISYPDSVLLRSSNISTFLGKVTCSLLVFNTKFSDLLFLTKYKLNYKYVLEL